MWRWAGGKRSCGDNVMYQSRIALVDRRQQPLKQSSVTAVQHLARSSTNCVISAADGRLASPPPAYGKQTGRPDGQTDGPYRRRTPAAVIGRGRRRRHKRSERCNNMLCLVIADRSKLAGLGCQCRKVVTTSSFVCGFTPVQVLR